MVLAAYAGRLFLLRRGGLQWMRLSALRLPSYKGGTKGFLKREGKTRVRSRIARTGKPRRHPEVAAQRPSKDAAQAPRPSSFEAPPIESGSHLRMTGNMEEKAQCTATNDIWASAAFPAG